MNGHSICKYELGYHHPLILFSGSGSVCSLGWAPLWKILTLMVNRSHPKETGHIYILYTYCALILRIEMHFKPQNLISISQV